MAMRILILAEKNVRQKSREDLRSWAAYSKSCSEPQSATEHDLPHGTEEMLEVSGAIASQHMGDI